jgi:ribosomal 50S subunit-associated protein YjgA (DUF615 family)
MDVDDPRDERPSRTTLQRKARSLIAAQRQMLTDFLVLPEHKMPLLRVSDSAYDDMMLLRRMPPTGARARLLKNLAGRLEDEDRASLARLLAGEGGSVPEEDSSESPVDILLERLMSGGDEALQALRDEHPEADHQQLRQLVLKSRRNPEGVPARSARKKLQSILQNLHSR